MLRKTTLKALLLGGATVAAHAQYVPHLGGEVSAGQEFRRDIGAGLVFALEPERDQSGWTIRVYSKQVCDADGDLAGVVTPPFRFFNHLYLYPGWGMSAKEVSGITPREFQFVTNCVDYKTEADRLQIVLWPYSYSKTVADRALANLGTSQHGDGKLTIVDTRVSEKIDWLKFTLDLTGPKRKLDGRTN